MAMAMEMEIDMEAMVMEIDMAAMVLEIDTETTTGMEIRMAEEITTIIMEMALQNDDSSK